jgi:putative regulator of septum formation
MVRRVTAAVALLLVLGACSTADDASDASDESDESDAPLPAASVADEGEATSVFDLDVGQCYNTPTETDVTEVNVVDCDDPHQYEIYALPRHPAGPDEDFPGEEEIGAFSDEACLGAAFEDYVGVDYQSSELLAFSLQPSAQTWAIGDREFICSAYLEGEDLEGSVAGSER